ncbi:GH12 family glycosyl hydrolase domain-containing protein [Rhizomonospora bruguierae]|uniref:GH12 family glycosyl hydrolase domain-containing protein n=1 Tax=Rhizomonospora bruguierae TaxID=1581705 RepID=UPI001BCB0BEB|nr:cellulose binding domain-containing protein [Micromonospora sp. NBRC 107566]
MRRLRAIALAAVMVAGGAVAAVATAPTASADTEICTQYGTTTIGGKYVVMNNRWGASTAQCINVTSSGFQVTQAAHNNATNGAPASYPAIYIGCHYTNCSPGTNLPIQISQISSASSSISLSYPSSGTYDAAYDIWLDPTARKDGQNQTEIMIWLNRQGPIQPVGSKVGTMTLEGRSWDVWYGNSGWNVLSFVATSVPVTSFNFNVMSFINETRNRGYAQNSWYLTSIQAGFEPWVGGTGLAINSFSATVNGGGSNPPPTNPPPTNPPPTNPPPTNPPPGGGSCRVTYTANSWNNGFTGDVTINAGSSAVNGWTLTFKFPGNQQITSAWNATVTQSGQSVTAKNVSYNGSIPANGSTSFGFQGTYSGTNGNPTNFALNGTACS